MIIGDDLLRFSGGVGLRSVRQKSVAMINVEGFLRNPTFISPCVNIPIFVDIWFDLDVVQEGLLACEGISEARPLFSCTACNVEILHLRGFCHNKQVCSQRQISAEAADIQNI